MKTKITKKSRNLIIAMLLGDGTISNNNSFKLSHSLDQEEYLKWKIKLLNNNGIRNNGLKYYTSNCGYNKNKTVSYTQLNVLPVFKLLRRIMYKPFKKINNLRILNRLDALGLAIWYMDDGHINVLYQNNKVKSIYVKIATCQSKEDNQVIIDYFKNVWQINFYQFSEGRNTYSISCGTKEAKKFISIVKPYVLQIPCMWYKVRNKMTKQEYNSYLVDNQFIEMPDIDIFQ
jgi:hypothetical protein